MREVWSSTTNLKCLLTFGGNDEFVEALLRHDVRFLVVGGLAVQYYVPARDVDDLDLLVDPSDENAGCLYTALTELYLKAEFEKDALCKSGQHLPIKTDRRYYLDVLTPRAEIDFSDEWNSASLARIGRSGVRVASKSLLCRMKADSDRPKDIADIQALTRL